MRDARREKYISARAAVTRNSNLRNLTTMCGAWNSHRSW